MQRRLDRDRRDAVDGEQLGPGDARGARLDQELHAGTALEAANPKTPPDQLALDRGGVRIALQSDDHS
jgi:hypothetical protein